MRHSPEALHAFAEAATLGSFSAAARKLGKRQSTVSEAIGNLEIDLGLTLFDRSTRQPTLTEAGRAMLTQVRRVLEASERMDRLAAQMAGGLEARLTLVVSDTYQSDRYEQTLALLEQRFPELELECLIAEYEDVLDIIQQGRAQLGLVATQPTYPPDIGAATIAEQSEIGLFVGRQHPLAQYGDEEVPHTVLRDTRELRLNTFVDPVGPRAETTPVRGLRRWHASGLRLYVYSSGSVAAQKLLFAHTPYGDLLPLFSGYFDTTTGPKLEPLSYARIAGSLDLAPRSIVFLSDHTGETRAAAAAGLQTIVLAREGVEVNTTECPIARSFDEIVLKRPV